MKEKTIQEQLNELQKQVTNLQKANTNKSPESKLRAEKKYYKSIRPFSLRFKQSEDEIWEFFNTQANKTQYLKNLIVKDMGYKNWAHFMNYVPTEQLREEWNKELKDKQKRLNPLSSHTLKTLKVYIEENKISNDEWAKIEDLFYFREDVSNVACDALSLGVLPYDAWTPVLIAGEIEELYLLNGKNVTVDWHLFDDEKVKEKFLFKHFIDSPDSELDKHIDFYCIDQQQVEKYFKDKILSNEPLLVPAEDGFGFEQVSPDEARRRLKSKK